MGGGPEPPTPLPASDSRAGAAALRRLACAPGGRLERDPLRRRCAGLRGRLSPRLCAALPRGRPDDRRRRPHRVGGQPPRGLRHALRRLEPHRPAGDAVAVRRRDGGGRPADALLQPRHAGHAAAGGQLRARARARGAPRAAALPDRRVQPGTHRPPAPGPRDRARGLLARRAPHARALESAPSRPRASLRTPRSAGRSCASTSSSSPSTPTTGYGTRRASGAARSCSSRRSPCAAPRAAATGSAPPATASIRARCASPSTATPWRGTSASWPGRSRPPTARATATPRARPSCARKRALAAQHGGASGAGGAALRERALRAAPGARHPVPRLLRPAPLPGALRACAPQRRDPPESDRRGDLLAPAGPGAAAALGGEAAQ